MRVSIIKETHPLNVLNIVDDRLSSYLTPLLFFAEERGLTVSWLCVLQASSLWKSSSKEQRVTRPLSACCSATPAAPVSSEPEAPTQSVRPTLGYKCAELWWSCCRKAVRLQECSQCLLCFFFSLVEARARPRHLCSVGGGGWHYGADESVVTPLVPFLMMELFCWLFKSLRVKMSRKIEIPKKNEELTVPCFSAASQPENLNGRSHTWLQCLSRLERYPSTWHHLPPETCMLVFTVTMAVLLTNLALEY